jgi:phosphate transport system substrate-binding protein
MKLTGLATLFTLGIICSIASAATLTEMKIGGGGAACKGFFSPYAEYFKADTGIKMTVTPTTPVQGLIDLNAGVLDVAVAAVPFSTMINGAAKKGVTLDPNKFTVTEIGTNHTLVFLHKTNNVSELSKKQLKDIFTGKITNWKDVGGDDREIIVVWGSGTPGQNELFTRQILDGEAVVNSAKVAGNYVSIKEIIEWTTGTIGIDPQGFKSATTNNPNTPAVISPVIAVTKGKPRPEIENLYKYIKD